MKLWPFTLQETEYKPVAEEDFQGVTEVENLSQRKRRKKKKILSKTSPAKQTVGEWLLSTSIERQDTRKTWLAAHELPQLVTQTRSLTADTSLPFAEFGILTVPFLSDYMQICKELTFPFTGKCNPTEMNRVWKPESTSQTPKYSEFQRNSDIQFLKSFHWNPIFSPARPCWITKLN